MSEDDWNIPRLQVMEAFAARGYCRASLVSWAMNCQEFEDVAKCDYCNGQPYTYCGKEGA